MNTDKLCPKCGTELEPYAEVDIRLVIEKAEGRE